MKNVRPGFIALLLGLCGWGLTGCSTPGVSTTTAPPEASPDPAEHVVFTPRISSAYQRAGTGTKAEWVDAANERINQYRKAYIAIQVLDGEGNPIPNAKIQLTQKQHSFRFGQHLPPASPGEDLTIVPSLLPGINSVTMEEDFRWSRWAFGDPERLEDGLKTRIQTLAKAGYRIRAGALVWPGWNRPNPPGLADLPAPELEARLRQRIESLVELGGSQVQDWDVVNFPLRDQDFQKKLGANALGDWFRYAYAMQPTAHLNFNTANLPTTPLQIQTLTEMVTRLKQTGVPLSGVGIQARFAHQLADPEAIAAGLSTLREMHIPLEITALETHVADPAIETAFATDFITLAFAEPAISGVTSWGEIDSPISRAMSVLAHEQWNSSGTYTTDATGLQNIKAYLGDYAIVVQAGESTYRNEFTLSAKGEVLHFKAPQALPKSLFKKPDDDKKTELPKGPINLDAQPPAPPPAQPAPPK